MNAGFHCVHLKPGGEPFPVSLCHLAAQASGHPNIDYLVANEEDNSTKEVIGNSEENFTCVNFLVSIL